MAVKQRLFFQLFVITILILGFSPIAIAQSAVDQTVEDAEPVYYGPKIEVNVAARHMKVYDEKDQLVKIYKVAVGSGRHPTPIGPRTMSQVVWNPWWIPPKTSAWAKNSKDTPPGPNNPLGPVKMNLGRAILFHGTNKPKTVGFAKSHGCMRMISEEAKELASWIQQRVMNDKTNDENYDEFKSKVDKSKRRSHYVKIQKPVPVNIVYEFAEVVDGQLNIYQDVYWRVKNKMKAVKDALVAAGYKVEKLDMDFVETQLKQAKNKKDITLDVAILLKKNKRLREEYGKVAMNDVALAD